MNQLDRTDRQIIALLQDNARLSNKELAAAAGIAPSTCSERVRRLKERGVFAGFHAVLEPAFLGIRIQAMIAIRLRRHSAQEVETFRGNVTRIPEVVGVFHVTGANDYLVHVVVRDAEHLREVAVGSFITLPEVAHIETSLIFEHYGKRTLPDLT